MSLEEFEARQKRKEEIKDTVNCYSSVEDEVLKLLCLVNKAHCQKDSSGNEVFNKSYLLEKIARILNGVPISLGHEALQLFISLKMQQHEESRV